MVIGELGNTIVLGLLEANLAELKKDRPILIREGQHGARQNIVIVYGETHAHLYAKLEEKGIITDDTIIDDRRNEKKREG